MSLQSYNLLKLVERSGETLTLRKVTTSGSYNPATGSVSGEATTDYGFTGYFYNYQTDNPDMVGRGQRRCVIPALGLAVEPDEDDQIVGRGDTVNIVRVTTMYYAGAVMCYLCHVEE